MLKAAKCFQFSSNVVAVLAHEHVESPHDQIRVRINSVLPQSSQWDERRLR
jgi:hypothetical protein